MKDEKIYIYAELGAGIPGIPHEITKEQAKVLGILEILLLAIEKGIYVVKKETSMTAENKEN